MGLLRRFLGRDGPREQPESRQPYPQRRRLQRPDRAPRDEEMPDGMRSQPGVGDLEEDFRAVTAGFEDMHTRVPSRMVVEEPADVPADPEPQDPADPLDLDSIADPLDELERDLDRGLF